MLALVVVAVLGADRFLVCKLCKRAYSRARRAHCYKMGRTAPLFLLLLLVVVVPFRGVAHFEAFPPPCHTLHCRSCIYMTCLKSVDAVPRFLPKVVTKIGARYFSTLMQRKSSKWPFHPVRASGFHVLGDENFTRRTDQIDDDLHHLRPNLL